MICEQLMTTDIRDYGIKDTTLTEVFVGPYAVSITFTPCHFGGQRAWFICRGCGRRVAILYPLNCRTCVGARYACESKTPHVRRIRKAIKWRTALGQEKNGTLAPFPPRPKGMHQKTYQRLKMRSIDLEAAIWEDEARWLGMLAPQGNAADRRFKRPTVPSLLLASGPFAPLPEPDPADSRSVPGSS